MAWHGERCTPGVYKVENCGGMPVYEFLGSRLKESNRIGTIPRGERVEVFEVSSKDEQGNRLGKVGEGHELASRWALLFSRGYYDMAYRVADLPSHLDTLVLTLHVGEPDPTGLIDVVATTMRGEEIAHIQVDLAKDTRALKAAMQEELDTAQPINLMKSDGSLLSDLDALLSDAFQFGS